MRTILLLLLTLALIALAPVRAELLWIKKHPNPQTLLSKTYAAEAPAGYEASTEAAAAAWVAEQLAAGWQPAPLPVAPAAGVWTALDFFERFTEAEQLAIFESDHAAVRLFRAKLLAAQEVRGDDPRTLAGLDLLVAQGLITAERKAAILAP